MTRTALLTSLQNFAPESAEERASRDAIADLVRNEERCFHRDCFDPGHVTGSALLISHDGQRVLLNHHKFLGLWLCFGGHADGEADIFNVARRELIEESGVVSFRVVSNDIFDLDVHDIPANPRKGEGPHKHYDLCYLFQTTDSDDFAVSDESHGIEWCDYDEALRRTAPDARMQRMLKRWKQWLGEK